MRSVGTTGLADCLFPSGADAYIGLILTLGLTDGASSLTAPSSELDSVESSSSDESTEKGVPSAPDVRIWALLSRICLSRISRRSRAACRNIVPSAKFRTGTGEPSSEEPSPDLGWRGSILARWHEALVGQRSLQNQKSFNGRVVGPILTL